VTECGGEPVCTDAERQGLVGLVVGVIVLVALVGGLTLGAVYLGHNLRGEAPPVPPAEAEASPPPPAEYLD